MAGGVLVFEIFTIKKGRKRKLQFALNVPNRRCYLIRGRTPNLDLRVPSHGHQG